MMESGRKVSPATVQPNGLFYPRRLLMSNTLKAKNYPPPHWEVFSIPLVDLPAYLELWGVIPCEYKFLNSHQGQKVYDEVLIVKKDVDEQMVEPG